MNTTLARVTSRACAIVAVLAMVACTPIVRRHGYVPSEEDLAGIIIGVDTRATVADIVGPPTSSGVRNDSGIYYVASEFHRVGPFEPREVERQVVAVTFDEAGVVQNVARYGLEDGEVIVLSRRVTETTIKDRTFIRQLLGNIGNFNASTLVDGPS